MERQSLRRVMPRWVAVIGAVFFAGFAAASAAPIKITFSGELESITTGGVDGNANLETIFSVGDSVSGMFIYDPDAAVFGIDDSTFASFSGALSAFQITIGSSDFTASGGTVLTYDDHMAGDQAPLRDGFFAQGLNAITGPTVGGASANRLQFSLLSSDLTTVSSTGPFGLADILNLISSNLADGNTNFVAFDDGGTLRFSLDDVSAEAVPLPGAAILFGSVLAGGFLRKRRQANA